MTRKILITLVVVLGLMSCRNEIPNLIVTEVPKRAEGQTDVIQLRAPKLDTVRVGFIGLGMRGPSAVSRFTHIPGVKINAICDIRPERIELVQKLLKDANLPAPVSYSGDENAWKKLCERDDIDLVYVATDWRHHVPMALYAMEQGKHVAVEVPGATTLDDIWALIDKSEQTRKHCMMLENCIYDFFELTTLNMAQKGLFGEILHVEGSYIHNLEQYWVKYWNNWRLDYNRKHRGDIYPTHGMGPACQLLNIHRGDKMNYLVSMDTKAVGGVEYLKKTKQEEVTDFKNGDHTMTMIRTEKGKTIHIQHDVMSPRPYTRMYQLTGTKGFANKYPFEGYALRPSQLDTGIFHDTKHLSSHQFLPDSLKKVLMQHYQHPIQKELSEMAKKVGGHGGMDFIMDYRLVYCLRNGLPLDMDVYDLAEWSCLGALTAISLENNSAPVAIPDFTRGSWNKVQGYKHAMAD